MDKRKLNMLGMRIKEARLAKKMTQSDLAGDFITRNMLSQVESGSAAPSMSTLEYLSQALDIPMSVLISDAPGDEQDSKIDLLLQAKGAFAAQQYMSVIHLADEFPPAFYDEGQALLARAHFELAKAEAVSGNFRNAIDHLESAQAASLNGIYTSVTINAQSTLLIEKCCREINEAKNSLK